MTNEDFFNKIYVPLSLFVTFERVTQGLRVRGSWRPNRNCNILTPLLWPSTLCFSRSPDAQPEAQRPTLLSDLLHLISNFSGPQLNRGPRAPSAWCGFPYHISSITPSDLWLELSWLSYIIVQCPLSCLLDLWNRMFDRHQAEITVMQFTGHSLPVHQSMSVPWEFFLPRPISSANFCPRDFLW